MTHINKLFRVFIFCISIINTSAFADSKQYPEINQYVQQLVSEAQALLNNTHITIQDRANQSKVLMKTRLDLDWMAMYTLGRYRKELTPAQQQEFKQVYAEYIVTVYSDIIKSYKGEKCDIKQVRQVNPNEFIVKTVIIQANGQPSINVDYLVRSSQNQGSNNIKIFDIITEGVSMINAQKSEFNSTLYNTGFSKLINTLKAKSST